MFDLPDLSSPYALTDDHIASYQENGHVVLRGVCSPEEIAAYRPVIAGATMRYNRQTLPLAERSTYGKAFLQITNLWQRDEAVRQFVLAQRFAQIAAGLMGVTGTRLYHDQALFKEAGGGFTPWHQDQYYWPLATDNTITMWMPLVDVTANMGVMRFASGSHHAGYLGELPISDESEATLSEFVAEHGYQLTQPQQMAAGDATFHSGWMLHNAPGNDTDRVREVMTIIYYADGVRISPADNPNRESDLRAWFPGLQPGDLAATELNPLVYTYDS